MYCPTWPSTFFFSHSLESPKDLNYLNYGKRVWTGLGSCGVCSRENDKVYVYRENSRRGYFKVYTPPIASREGTKGEANNQNAGFFFFKDALAF